MTPIERAHQAVGEIRMWDGDTIAENLTREEIATAVRAVLQAIREPSEAMVTAANAGPGRPTNAVASGLWVRMIDAALSECESAPKPPSSAYACS